MATAELTEAVAPWNEADEPGGPGVPCGPVVTRVLVDVVGGMGVCAGV